MSHRPESRPAALACRELYVHLSWQTQSEEPLFADDQIRQAVCQAIGTRTRFQFCHLLGFHARDRQVHCAFRFPASLPISHLAQISQQAAQEAVFRLQEILSAVPRRSAALWDADYCVKTLSAEEAQQAEHYLRRQSHGANSARPVV